MRNPRLATVVYSYRNRIGIAEKRYVMRADQTNKLNIFETAKTAQTSLLTVTQAAKTLRVSSATVRNWQLAGKLPAIKTGKGYLFESTVVELLLNDKTNSKKLTRRANKKASTKRFSPREYSLSKANIAGIQELITNLDSLEIDRYLSEILYICTLTYLTDTGLVTIHNWDSLDGPVIQTAIEQITKKNIRSELTGWHKELNTDALALIKNQTVSIKLERQKDMLGFLYQSLLLEGKKAELGSYYTPSWIVDEIVSKLVSENSKVADPCCGTGQFLLAFASQVKDPTRIYGFDIDPIAVHLARINLMLAYPNQEFTPQIYMLNTLTNTESTSQHILRDFDVIATNPPWGAEYNDSDRAAILGHYPHITSLESFSYFLAAGLQLLKKGGVLSFILPESILNVKQHSDIRNFILSNYQIQQLSYLERPFSGVFSKVIRIDIKNEMPTTTVSVLIKNQGNAYRVVQNRFLKRRDYVIDANITDIEQHIIEKVFSVPHTTLVGKADWALGIVTGNNKKYIFETQVTSSMEPIYTGKDIAPFFLKPANAYIEFTPEKFQQVAPIEKYRSNEKLLYKFISDKLIFAYDDEQRLTLNSANILIPKDTLPAKTLTATLNSSIYQFIFNKKHNSIKVLRHHLEELPLPVFNIDQSSRMTAIVDTLFEHKDPKRLHEVEQVLFEYFGFTEEEITVIRKNH